MPIALVLVVVEPRSSWCQTIKICTMSLSSRPLRIHALKALIMYVTQTCVPAPIVVASVLLTLLYAPSLPVHIDGSRSYDSIVVHVALVFIMQ